jgi:hypothetical protein
MKFETLLWGAIISVVVGIVGGIVARNIFVAIILPILLFACLLLYEMFKEKLANGDITVEKKEEEKKDN